MMEGLGVAASVVAVVTIGLQTTKFIYETVNGIKDGSSSIQNLITASKDLLTTLEQIKEVAEKAKEILDENEVKFFEGIKPLLSKCVKELMPIQRKLNKYTLTSDHHKWNEAKRNMRLIYHEKEFEKMWESIHYYEQLFALQLSKAGM